MAFQANASKMDRLFATSRDNGIYSCAAFEAMPSRAVAGATRETFGATTAFAMAALLKMQEHSPERNVSDDLEID